MASRVLGVLNGGDLPLATLEKWANSATNLYAADGAADRLLSLGHRPVIVGDGDSGNRDRWPSGLDVRVDDDQETSDTDKLIAAVAGDDHEVLALAGIEGDNPMHTLANLHSVARADIPVVLRYRRFDGWVVTPSRPWSRSVAAGLKVSVIPLVECTDVNVESVKWPLAGATLAMGRRISLSNQSTGHVNVTVGNGIALVLVKREPGDEPPWS